jgi:hypothetical protein
LYEFVRVLHSLNRWVVLVLLATVVILGFRGWRARAAWTPRDHRIARMATGVIDLQMLLGLLLYVFLSPYTRSGFRDIAAAMADQTLRFWLVEHAPAMAVAVVLVHVGMDRTSRALAGDTDAVSTLESGDRSWAGHRTVTIWFGLAMVVILAAIPWPFLPYGRPLLSFP